MITAYLGIGANLTPSGYASLPEALEAAVARIGKRYSLIKQSKWYRTAPVPISDQPDFLNAVLAIELEDSPEKLLAYLNEIEQEFGRVRTVRNAARVLDIDILFFGTQIIASKTLEVPHPRLYGRAFVLRPLAEIAPEFCDPASGQKMTALYDDFLQTAEGGQLCQPL